MRYREFRNEITPAIPLIFLVDSAGGQVIATGGGTFITWDTIKIKTSHFQYTADDDRVSLKANSSGIFKINFESSVTGNATEVHFWIYKNGAVVAESKSCQIVNNGDACAHSAIFYYIYLEQGDYIQIKGEGSDATVTTGTNNTRLSIEFLPMKGWDGSTGGRVDYKGGLER